MTSAEQFNRDLCRLVNEREGNDLSPAEIVGLLMLTVHKVIIATSSRPSDNPRPLPNQRRQNRA